MTGEPLGGQERLFYEFCPEDRVPANHLLRKLDAVLDLGWLRAELRPFYSPIARPSVCPEPMLRMPLVGNCHSIRSERRLMETEAHLPSRRRRKKIETLFGEVKRNLGLTRLRLCGLSGARDEFLITATVQNLKRLARYATIPPPITDQINSLG